MSKQVNILFSDEQYQKLRKLAWDSKTSIAAIVRVLATSPSPAPAEDIKHEITLRAKDLATIQGASFTDSVGLDES